MNNETSSRLGSAPVGGPESFTSWAGPVWSSAASSRPAIYRLESGGPRPERIRLACV